MGHARPVRPLQRCVACFPPRRRSPKRAPQLSLVTYPPIVLHSPARRARHGRLPLRALGRRARGLRELGRPPPGARHRHRGELRPQGALSYGVSSFSSLKTKDPTRTYMCVHCQTQVLVADSPSMWPGQARVLFRNACDNHLCALSFDPATKQHRFRDYRCLTCRSLTQKDSASPPNVTNLNTNGSHDARAPVVGAGGPLAVSRQEAVWIGEDHHVFRLALDTLALIDHSAATGICARAPVRLLDPCKIVYAEAREGRLVEESLQGGSQHQWKVTEHSQEEHRAPSVAASGSLLFECVFGSARVLYRGAVDGRVYELWYCGEAWRVARRDDEDGCFGGAGAGTGGLR